MPGAGCPAASSGQTEIWPQATHTVGDLATEVVGQYLNESGYANFSDYWKDHKDRTTL